MIRIDVVEHTQEQVVLQVQGDLHSTEMDLLEGEVRRWRAQVAQVVLDLTKVPVVNWTGLGRLAQWVQEPPQAEPGTGARLNAAVWLALLAQPAACAWGAGGGVRGRKRARERRGKGVKTGENGTVLSSKTRRTLLDILYKMSSSASRGAKTVCFCPSPPDTL